MSDTLTNSDLVVAYDILIGLRKQGSTISERDKLDIMAVQILIEREAGSRFIFNDDAAKKVKRRFMND